MNRQIIIQFSDEEVEWVARNLYQLPHRVNDTHKKRAADAMAYWFVQAIKDGCIMGKMTWVINKKNNLRPVLRMASFQDRKSTRLNSSH